jgi:hypothetical protein
MSLRLSISLLLSIVFTPLALAGLGEQAKMEGELSSNNNSSFLQRISGSLDLSYTSNFYHPSSAKQDHYISNSASFNYSSVSNINYGLVLSAAKELKYQQRYLLDDSIVYVSTLLSKLNKSVAFTGAAYAILPTSKSSVRGSKLYTGIVTAPALSINFREYGINSFRIKLATQITKLFHQYHNAENGAPNVSYYIRPAVSLYYTPISTLTFVYTYKITESFNYKNTKNQSMYSSSAQAQLTLNKNWYLSTSVSTARRSYLYNGTDSDFDIFNSKDADYQLNIGYSF